MCALLRNLFGTPGWAVPGIVVLCLFVGGAIPFFAVAVGNQLGQLAALPALLLLGILLIYDYKKLFVLIILLRSIGDMVLESTQFSLGSAQMGIGGLINLAVILIACMLVLEKPQLFPTRLVRYWVPVLLMMCIGVFVSYEKTNAIKLYLGMLSYCAIFIIAIYTVRSIEDFNKAIRLVLWSSLIPTLYSCIDVALHMRDSSYRLQSTFSHANVQAFYLTLMLILCLYMLKSPLFNIKPLGRVLICAYMPVLLGQLLLTQTRSAWLACFLVFGLYALLFERKYLFYLLLSPLLVIFIPTVYERLTDLGQGNEVVRYARLNSFAWRVTLWESAIRWMEPLRLIYGYGLGSFGHHAQSFFASAGNRHWEAHNVYVQFFFDIGIVGVLCYLWLYAHVMRTIHAFSRIDRVSGFLLLAIVVQYLIISFSDNMFGYLVFNWYFWLVVGGACSLMHIQSQTKPASVSLGAHRSKYQWQVSSK